MILVGQLQNSNPLLKSIEFKNTTLTAICISVSLTDCTTVCCRQLQFINISAILIFLGVVLVVFLELFWLFYFWYFDWSFLAYFTILATSVGLKL